MRRIPSDVIQLQSIAINNLQFAPTESGKHKANTEQGLKY